MSCLSCYPWSPVREIKLESSTNSPFLSNTSFCQELHQNLLNYLRLENPHWPGWETCSVKWVCTSTLQEKKNIYIFVLFLQKALKLSSTWKGRSLVRMRISVLSCYAHQAGYFSCYAYQIGICIQATFQPDKFISNRDCILSAVPNTVLKTL